MDDQNSYMTKPGYIKAYLRYLGLPDKVINILYDVCIIKSPFDSRLDLDFNEIKF